MFDPRYFMYHEEVDFIFRAQKQGYPACYCPSVRARHYIGLGTKNDPLKKIYWTRRNSIYFLKQHKAGTGKWIKCLGTMLGSFLYTSAGLKFSRAGPLRQGHGMGSRDSARIIRRNPKSEH